MALAPGGRFRRPASSVRLFAKADPAFWPLIIQLVRAGWMNLGWSCNLVAAPPGQPRCRQLWAFLVGPGVAGLRRQR